MIVASSLFQKLPYNNGKKMQHLGLFHYSSIHSVTFLYNLLNNEFLEKSENMKVGVAPSEHSHIVVNVS